MKYKVLVKFRDGTSVEYITDTKPSYSFDGSLRKALFETYGTFSCVAEDVLYSVITNVT